MCFYIQWCPRTKTLVHPNITIPGERVEVEEHLRCLGITLDSLSLEHHTTDIYEVNSQQRLSAISKLRHPSVHAHLLLLLYHCIIEPRYITTMFTVIDKNKLLKITHLVGEIISIPTPSSSDCITSSLLRKVLTVPEDPGHPRYESGLVWCIDTPTLPAFHPLSFWP